MTREVVDPLRELLHDHRALSGLLVAVHEALARIERGVSSMDDELHELQDGVEGFREALLEHFGREQEGLFPFVVERVPATRERAEVLVQEHDRIAKLLTALARNLATLETSERGSGERPVGERAGDPSPELRLVLGRFQEALRAFEELYVAHTRSELAFLDDVAKALATDPDATRQLKSLLDAI